MTERNDSVNSPVAATAQHAVTGHEKGYHSPAEIIDRLPDTATPWQQDSAIRANYNFQKIDWNRRQNPMRTPTTRADGIGTFSLRKAMYYSPSMVQPDSTYRPECVAYRHGVAGDPVPYSIAGDDLITSILCASSLQQQPSLSQETSCNDSSKTSSIRNGKAQAPSPRPAKNCVFSSS